MTSASPFFLSEKGRGTDEPRAKLGKARVGHTRRIDGGTEMRSSAIRRTGEKFTRRRNFSPAFAPLSEADAAREFSAVILDFSVGELAQAANRSKDTAKCWKQGRAFPNGVSLMALINEFPKVRDWVDAKTGGLNSPRGMSEGFALVEQIMSSDSAEGRAMRARLQQILAERGT